MKIKRGVETELDITDVAFGGRGVAKVDGLTIFVDQAVPLDRVKARIFKKKKSYAEARTVQLIKPSPFRTVPKCAYSGYCGGCKWQFLNYEQQLEFKRRHVVDAVERIGLIKDVPVKPVIPSDLIYGYRNKMEFSCTDRRWLLPEEMGMSEVDKGFALGLHVPGTFNKVLDIETCWLQPELGNSILADVRSYIKASGYAAYGLKSHEGFWRFLMVRHSVAHDQWLVNIVTAHEAHDTVERLAGMLAEKYDQVVSVVNNITGRKAGIAVGEREIPLSGPPYLKDRLGPYEFEISANSFFQTNTRGAERLYATVSNYAELTGEERLLDLYSGTGTIPIWLSENASQVVGIEIVSSAVSDARKNCQANQVSNCRFIEGDINTSLGQIDHRPDVMIIDPPRVGMHKTVVQQILGMLPPRIVYVSCNPATLARDLGMLNTHYQVIEIQPVDMFPHTFHIESVAQLVRRP